MASSSIFWFRRDLRLNDNPALLAAMAESEAVIPVFILDPKLIKTAGSKRLAYLGQSLHHLDDSLGNKLHVIAGDQITVLKDLMRKNNASSVHISTEYEPHQEDCGNQACSGFKSLLVENPNAAAEFVFQGSGTRQPSRPRSL